MVMPLSIQLSVRAVKKLELYALKGSVSSSAKKKKKDTCIYTCIHRCIKAAHFCQEAKKIAKHYVTFSPLSFGYCVSDTKGGEKVVPHFLMLFAAQHCNQPRKKQ